MKITICGSIAFTDQMQVVKKELETLGHEVRTPPLEVLDQNGELLPVAEYYALRKTTTATEGWIWERMGEALRVHFDKVEWADAVLVLNYTKNEVSHYIGPSAFLEMGIAFHNNKKIFLYNPIPDAAYKEEILGMRPIVIDQDLTHIV